ncbi:MAG: DNA polymerase III subunit gamma/tau [Acidobacteriaceae bacterium]
MSYQVLARKYRPQRFADVVGQDHVTRTLLNALEQGRTAHGYIFSGHRGIGKTTVARILAMALNCRAVVGSAERPTPEPCGTCVACTEVRAGNAVDVIEIDAATNRGIDEVRELREAARYNPARDRYKIYILDEAHQITDAAFNALLKTLEEPPDHVVFMMATTQPEDIPQTIRSRCQHFSFHAVRFEVILQQLRQIAEQEHISAEEAALALLAEAGDGSIRDALSVMDQAIASAAQVDGQPKLEAEQVRLLMGSVSNVVFEQMMQAVKEQNAAAMLEQAATLLDSGNAPQQIARQLVRFLRNSLMAKVAGEGSGLLQVSEEERARAGRIAALFTEEDLTRFLNAMLRTFDDLNYRQEQRFHLELGLLKLVYTQRLLPLDDILRRLSTGAILSSSAKQPGTPGGTISAPSTAHRPAPAPAASKLRGGTVALHSASSSSPTASQAQAKNVTPFPAADHTLEKQPFQAGQSSSPIAQSPAVPAEDGMARKLPDAETVCAAICGDLANAGHQTLASLLEGGVWQWEGRQLQVQAAASKTMLEMAYNAGAQRTARDGFRRLVGAEYSLDVRPGPGSNGATSATQPKETRSSTPPTADHPLVRRAQELFHAEVRSVVDLRERG